MKTIVLQDYDTDLLHILTLYLESVGYKVFPFQNCGDHFIKTINELELNLVILDYGLKGAECSDALTQIRLQHQKIPVICFSTDEGVSIKHKLLGFDDFLIKPFDLDNLYETINRNIEAS